MEPIGIEIAIDSIGRDKMLILSTPFFASNIRERAENACSNMQHFFKKLISNRPNFKNKYS